MPSRKKQRISQSSSSSRRSLRRGSALALTPRITQRTPLPADLIYDIVAEAVGDYFADIILTPDDATSKDTILSLLHVSRICREVTLKFLYYLWGDAFINQSKRHVVLMFDFVKPCPDVDAGRPNRTLSDFRPMIRLLREWSLWAHHKPAALPNHAPVRRVAPEPEFMKMRCVRHPIFPILRIAAFFLESTKHAMRYKASGAWDLMIRDEPLFQLESVGPLREVYNAIPAHLRVPLLGRIWDKLIEQAIVWSSIRPLSETVSVMRILLFRYGGISSMMGYNWRGHVSLNQYYTRLQEELGRQLELAQKRKADADAELAAFLEVQRPEIMPMVTVEDVSSRAFTQVLRELRDFSLEGGIEINRLGRQCLAVFLSPGEEQTRFTSTMRIPT
ncbi:hypothetical protein EVG20_g10255 [Dentipellis fragilis]|uniref:Uncharacterized protein n=1 Tax=Dentipellis fragilis TaxID=205917 RepID=A0A4Y9XUM3_9AGAM|nr:hypothetical protein EVG20_g10255 [Dentipellis fragilis]